MTSIKYSEIYSSYFVKIEAYDLFEISMSDTTRDALLCGYLHSACADPYVRQLFSHFTLYDDHSKAVKEENASEEKDASKDETAVGEETTTPSDSSKDETATGEELTDTIKDGIIEFEMRKPSTDDSEDKDFVSDVLSWGMVYYWTSKYVYSPVEMSQFIGTASEKYYSQSQHISALMSLREDARRFQRSLICERDSYKNDWLDKIIPVRRQS